MAVAGIGNAYGGLYESAYASPKGYGKKDEVTEEGTKKAENAGKTKETEGIIVEFSKDGMEALLNDK